MAIVVTYDAPTNIIRVTGGTEGTPATFADIQAANDGGGWGVITNQCTIQYCLSARLYIGDGATPTYFSSKSESITWADGILTAHWQYLLAVYANANCVFGELVNEANKSTKKGCSVYILESTYWGSFGQVGGTFYIYSSMINSIEKWFYLRADRLWNLISDNMVSYSSDCYDVIITNISTAFYGTPPNINKVTILNANYIFLNYSGFTISNLYSPDLITRTQHFHYGVVNLHTYYIDCDLNLWSFSWGVPANCRTQMAYRQYTINIEIADKDGVLIDGATVICEDKDGNEIFNIQTGTTDTGKIDEQTINYIRYYYDGGATSHSYSPHKFTISKAGYETLVLDAITVDDKIVWHLELQEEVIYPAEEDVEVGVQYGANGVEFTGTYLGLKGENLTAELERSVALVGHLENKVELSGELQP